VEVIYGKLTLGPVEKTDSRQQLLERILVSRQFAHAHTLKRILRYLCEAAEDPENPSPKEYDIALRAMGRPPSFDPRTDPVVRVSVASIRDRLLAYFATEGAGEPLRLYIPKGQYGAVFLEQGATEPVVEHEKSPPSLAKFWAPYFSGQAANVIVYTEPLFFRDDHGRFLRDIYVNDPAVSAKELQRKLPQFNVRQLSPSFHYLSAGEVHCMLSISRMFHELGIPVETRNSRTASWNELGNCNLVLLGSTRTNSFLDALQGDNSFIATADHIENRAPAPGEQECYRGHRYLDGKLPRLSEYAVVTRRPGLKPDRFVTTIAANHGRAIGGAGHILTLEDRVEGLLERMKLAPEEQLPAHFQLLIHVEMINIDDEVVHVDCVAHRILR
jgi:hypothetical protein